MGLDLSKLSDSDLQQIANGDMRMVSEAGLRMLAGEESSPSKTVEPIYDPMQNVKDIGGGAVRGAGSIGATILAPFDYGMDLVTGDREGKTSRNTERRQSMNAGLQSLGVDTNSTLFGAGKLGSEISGTAGLSGLISRLAQTAGAAPNVVNALNSGGFSLGTPAATTFGGKALDAGLRVGSGALTGGAQAGLINPADAKAGAVIGGAMPVVAKVAGEAGKLIAGNVPDEVALLAKKAEALGINVPADRIANSKPLNALASSLNYVPLSGRAAKEKELLSQFNRAVSRTFGQDSDNVTMSLRKAQGELGSKFDTTLQNTRVNVDNEFINDMAEVEKLVSSELNPLEAKVITNKIGEILDKGSVGSIDGQAAYNIKKALDRIGNRNSNDAYYARELKKKLMSALNRSLPADEAQAFATLRQQYGNMLDLEGLARNGAEGGISVARMANMKGINNPEMQDLADIAAQFLITREAPHGAAQRVTLGAMGLGAGGFAPYTIPFLVGGMALGRGANSALKSDWMKRSLTSPSTGDMGVHPWLRSGLLSIPANQ